MSRPIRWCFLAEPPRLTRGETPRLIPPQDEKSGALGLFCKWLEIETLYTMVTAGPEIFDQLPLEFANWLPKASHPTNGVHKMFGAPMDTQAAYLNQARLKDKHLLFELVTDDMLARDYPVITSAGLTAAIDR